MDLDGTLLISMPHLVDPNFYRSVVLILEHGDEGTLGLVVNRPSMLTAPELCTSQGIDWLGGEQLIHVGGPVQPTSIWMLHADTPELPDSSEVFDGCWLTTSREGLEAVAHFEDMQRRVFGGYAGWGSDQLTDEIRAGAWITRPANLGLVFSVDAETVWDRSLREVGINPGALVPGGGLIQ